MIKLSSDSCYYCGTTLAGRELLRRSGEPIWIGPFTKEQILEEVRQWFGDQLLVPGFDYLWEDKDQMVEGYEAAMGRPMGITGTLVVYGVRIPLDRAVAFAPCCTKCKEISAKAKSAEESAGKVANFLGFFVFVATFYFAFKFSSNPIGLPQAGPFLLYLLLFGLVGGGAIACVSSLLTSPALKAVDGNQLFLEQAKREMTAARQSGKQSGPGQLIGR